MNFDWQLKLKLNLMVNLYIVEPHDITNLNNLTKKIIQTLTEA